MGTPGVYPASSHAGITNYIKDRNAFDFISAHQRPLAPDPATFTKGRDFAAWVGLTPLQKSTGGKQKLGATSKMGERTLRRLLIIGASTVVMHAARKGAPKGSWLARMIACKL